MMEEMAKIRGIFDMSDMVTKPGQYQPRNGMVAVVTGKMRRHCYSCNRIIPKGEKMMGVENHLSSGRRNEINFCRECVLEIAVKL